MIDLTGRKFGRWTVQEFADRRGNHYYWNCVCDCGSARRVEGACLKSGSTKSCGCYKKEKIIERSTKHGQACRGQITLIYLIWQAMLARCYNPKNKYYKNYGGRGVRVCERWHIFENFYADMGDPPEGMTLDRKDNDGDYCKENCHWATREEQMNNMRNNVWYEYQGENKTLTQWARHLDMKVITLWSRLNVSRWSIERAFTTPVKVASTKHYT